MESRDYLLEPVPHLNHGDPQDMTRPSWIVRGTVRECIAWCLSTKGQRVLTCYYHGYRFGWTVPDWKNAFEDGAAEKEAQEEYFRGALARLLPDPDCAAALEGLRGLPWGDMRAMYSISPTDNLRRLFGAPGGSPGHAGATAPAGRY